MTRIKSSVTHKSRVKKVIKAAKGYHGRRKNVYSVAKQNVMRAGATAFADRRKKKGDFRRLWQVRINAALRMFTQNDPAKTSDASSDSPRLSYSRFIFKLQQAKIELNRKTLAYLSIHDPKGFRKIIDEVQAR